MARVIVNGEVLRWAIERSSLTVDDLQKKFPKIYEWVTGKSSPTFLQLEKLAKAILVPFGYLFLSKPPKEQLPITLFRTDSSRYVDQPSPDLLETVQMMQRRQAWMRDRLIDEGYEQLSFVHSVKTGDDPKQVASDIRQTLGFKDDWAKEQQNWTEALETLRSRIEEAGIITVVNGIIGNNTHRKLNPREFRGFVLVDEYAPLLFVNGADYKAPRMFTFAHELAHLWLGSSAAFDLVRMQPANDQTEKMCNEIAAEFLVPEDKFRKEWDAAIRTEAPFQAIAKRFKVSELVAARRALDLGFIQKTEFFKFYEDSRDEEYKRRFVAKAKGAGGGDFYRNQDFRVGRLFANTIIEAVRENKLLYSEAYGLTGLSGKTFDKYIEHIGWGEK